MKIVELFSSLQGEGKLMGVHSTFVRTSGCNLRCTWCDTPFASWEAEGRQMTVPEVVQAVDNFGIHHVVLTGGEPMVWADLPELCQELKNKGHHLTLETAGTIYKPLAVDLASMSPKLSNSVPVERADGRYAGTHERHRLNLPALQQFIDTTPAFQLKFVVCQESDLGEIQAILAGLRGWRGEDVLLMPEGSQAEELTAKSRWLADLCQEYGYRFCPRLHVLLYGDMRGR